MIYIKTRTAGYLLAFGIFFATACATFHSPLDKAEENFNENNYSSAIKILNQYIRDNPNDVEALLFKLRVLDETAKSVHSPHERTDTYREMISTKESIQFMDAPDHIHAQTDSIVNIAWNREQQQGIELLQQDESDIYDQNFDKIISHLENALILDPLNETTYNLKATTHYRHGEINKSVSVLEAAGDLIPELSNELREKLAYFYLESGNIEGAIRSYKDLLDSSPDNQNYLHGLVNSYVLGEQHKNAIELLENLIQENSDNNLYKEALISEILFDLNKQIEKAINENNNKPELTATDIALLFTKIEELNSERSIQQISDFESNHSAAGLYKNSAFNLYTLADIVSKQDEKEAEELRQVADNFLKSSLSIWEKLAEDNPENTEILRNLYQVYLQLDMKNNAEMIRKNYNF